MKKGEFYILRLWLMPILLLLGMQQSSYAQCTAPVFTSAPTQGDTITLTAHQFSCEASYSFGFSASSQTFVSYNITLSGATGFSTSQPFTGFSYSAYRLGITTVRLEAVNGCGSDVRTFYIQTLDKSAPTIYGPSSLTLHGNCPQNATSVLNSNFTIVEHCTSRTVSISPSTIGVGGADYTITATDGYGNTATKTVYIDLLVPEIEVNGGTVSIANNDTIPSTTDGTDFGSVSVYNTVIKSYTVYNTGTDTLRINSATIANQTNGGGFSIYSPLPTVIAPGKTATLKVKLLANSPNSPTADVIIKSNDCDESTYSFRIGGTIFCPGVTLNVPSDTVYGSVNGGCYYHYTMKANASSAFPVNVKFIWSGATNGSYDTGPIGSYTYDFNVGVTKVIVQGTSICGSYAEDSFYLKVSDNIAPYISVSSATFFISSGCSVSTNQALTASAFDNCGGPVTISNDAPATLTVGSWTVKWTATDQYGNIRTANQAVTVIDGIKPTITAPGDVYVSTNNGSCSATNVTLGTPTTADNCAVDSVWNNAPASFTEGTNTVTWTVKDEAGNTAVTTQNVIVIDNEKPVVTVPNTITYYLNYGCTVASNLIDLSQATDNCGIDTVTNNGPTAFPIGATSVVVTAKDIHGNTATKSVVVEVLTNDVEVSGNMIIIDDGDATPIADDNTDFGTVAYEGSTTKTFTVTNLGDADLHINSITFNNNSNNTFSLVSGPAGNTLSQGQSADIVVKYTGNKGGTNTATLIINNSSCNKSSYDFVVKGVTNCPFMLFTTPQFVIVNNDPGVCGANYTYSVSLTSPLSTTLSYEFSGATTASGTGSGSGNFFNVGATTINITATNSCESVTNTSVIAVLENQNPVITAPADKTAYTDNGKCYASNVSLGTPAVSDNCGVDTFWNNAPSTYPIGVTAVTWTVRDIYGNTNTDTQNVHVSSLQPPVITAPATVTVNADNGSCSATNVSLGTPITTGVCGIDSVWNNAPVSYPVGNTTVTWNARDLNGNTATANQIVTVIDNQQPDITPPIDYYGYADSGKCYATIGGFEDPMVGDNCGIQSVTHNGTGTYPVGTTTLTWTVTDLHGNTNTTTQTVTIIDNQKPLLTLPPDLMIPADNGNCYATLADLGLTFTSDNCGIDSVWNNAPLTFPIGETQVVWTAKDIHGNTTTGIQNITVMDDQDPTITAPADITVNADEGYCWATVTNVGTPTTFDNCGVDSVWNNVMPSYQVGNNIVTWTAMDIHGNISTATQTIIVVDNQLPDITAPIDYYGYADSGKCYATISGFEDPTVGDNCGIQSVTHNGTGTYPVGTTVLTWTVTDLHGNTNTTTQNVTIVDDQKPLLSIPPDLWMPADNGKCYATISDLGLVFTSDNCGVDSVWNNAPATFPIGDTYVTWTVRDIHGNTISAAQSISVMDDQNPTIAISDITINADNGSCAATNVSLGTPTTSDNCGVDSVWNNAPASYPVGVNSITWTVLDIHGNTSTTTQTVTVIDNQNPQITPPTDMYAYADSGSCNTTVDLEPLIAGDNCGILSETNDAPASFPVGTTVVTWTVTDIHGNVSTTTQNVTVEDNQKPNMTLPPDLMISADNGNCYATLTDLGLTFTSDNCGIDSVWNNAPSAFPVGETQVVWTAKDVNGNTTSGIQNITVMDDQNPTIAAPADITVNADNDKCSANNVALGMPNATDNCGIDSVWNNAPSIYMVGSTTVVWTAIDIHGNSSTDTQTVTVIDNQQPDITPPTDVYGYADSGSCYTSAVLIDPLISGDNCGILSETNDAPTSYPVGITIITWTVTDIHGNIATATQKVTIVDNQKPTITSPASVTVNADNGSCAATGVALGTPITADNCGVDSVYSDAPASFPVGTTTVTWTVKDMSGNTSMATQYVTVIDNQSPIIIPAATVTVNADNGNCSATNVALSMPNATDNCGVDSIWNDALNSYPVGTSTVTWTVIDIHGNISSATQDVIVLDSQAPVVSCKNYTVTLSNGTATIQPSDIDNGSMDNCGIASMVLSDSTFTCTDAGDHAVVLTVTDIHGNSASCTATVTVPAVPTVTIMTTPSDTTYTGGNPNSIYLGYGAQSATITATGAGGTGFTYSWSPVTNLSNANIQNPVFTPTAAGNYTYTVTASNGGGCSAISTVSFCVLDAQEYKNNGSTSGKVYVCLTKNNGTQQTKAVNPPKVAGYLQSGARLGRCDESCGSAAKGGKNIAAENDDDTELQGIDRATLANVLKVYPNPSQGTFTIDVPDNVKGGLVVIRDISGKEIRRERFNPNAQLRFTLDGVADGMYLIEVHNSGDVYREKVVIRR